MVGSKRSTRKVRPTSEVRTFGGKVYRLAGSMLSKPEADAMARAARRVGMPYRVVRTPISDIRYFKFGEKFHGKVYDIWIHGKPKYGFMGNLSRGN